MDVRFVTTTRELIDTVSIADGQVVTSKDSCEMFYDMDQTRYRVGCSIWNGIGKPDPFVTDANVSVFRFHPNGGSDVYDDNSLYGVVGDPIDDRTLQIPVKEGYTFDAWYEDAEFRGDPIEELPEEFPKGGTVYYASWLVNK